MADSTQQLIRREITARQEFVARVLTNPRLINSDDAGGTDPQWVVDLDIGSSRSVKKVQIKASGSGSYFYAQLNQTVLVRKTAFGRLLVIGPGDLSRSTETVTFYDLDTQLQTGQEFVGFTRVFAPFEFYQGTKAMKGTPDLTFAATGNTITRATGDWTTAIGGDGFSAADTIRVSRSSSNNNDLLIDSLTATVLTINVGTPVVNESLVDPAEKTISIGVLGSSAWGNDGDITPNFEFPRSEIVQATSAA